MHPTHDDSSRRFVGTSQAARHLGVSTRTLLRMEERGQIHPIRLPSGHRRYDLDELEGLLVEDVR